MVGGLPHTSLQCPWSLTAPGRVLEYSMVLRRYRGQEWGKSFNEPFVQTGWSWMSWNYKSLGLWCTIVRTPARFETVDHPARHSVLRPAMCFCLCCIFVFLSMCCSDDFVVWFCSPCRSLPLFCVSIITLLVTSCSWLFSFYNLSFRLLVCGFIPCGLLCSLSDCPVHLFCCFPCVTVFYSAVFCVCVLCFLVSQRLYAFLIFVTSDPLYLSKSHFALHLPSAFESYLPLCVGPLYRWYPTEIMWLMWQHVVFPLLCCLATVTP